MGDGTGIRRWSARIGRGIGAAIILTAAAGCALLPRSGPLATQIEAPEDPAATASLVAPLTPETLRLANRPKPLSFPEAMTGAAEIDIERLGPGDLLDIRVWEGGDAPLLGGADGVAQIESVPVSGRGMVYLPFLGDVRASGARLGDLRAQIQSGLSALTLDPQVDVRLREPRSRLVTVQGSVTRPGEYVIDRGATRLAPMLALAGGTSLPPEQIEVAIRRDGVRAAALLEDVYTNDVFNVALRPQDEIVLNPLRERLLVLGATLRQAEVPFPSRPFSLLSAIAAARGLNDNDADPTGVFVFRWEDPEIADAILTGPARADAPTGPGRPIVYRVDLTDPGALFMAQQFQMRDGDALFVTNAPLTELRKILQLFTLAIAPIRQTTFLAE